MGRPRINIDKKQFENLCGLQCTKEEIAAFFECHETTIDNWVRDIYDETFSVVFNKYSSRGKISLRRSQFKLAEKNASMAIFLGKQMLGQRDFIVNDTNDNVESFAEVLKEKLNETSSDR